MGLAGSAGPIARPRRGLIGGGRKLGRPSGPAEMSAAEMTGPRGLQAEVGAIAASTSEAATPRAVTAAAARRSMRAPAVAPS